MTEIRVRGMTLAEMIARQPKRGTYLRPTRLSAQVFRRHSVGGSGLILHEYDSEGRCQVRGCDIWDETEGESLRVAD